MAVVVVVLVIAACGVLGWRAGVLRRLVELVGLGVTIVAASRLASAVAPWLDARTLAGAASSLVVAYVVIIAAGLVLTSLAARGIEKFLHLTILGWLDRIGGAVCGLALGTLLASVGLIAVSHVPGGAAVREAFVDHPVGRTIYGAAPQLYRLVGDQGDAFWRELLEREEPS